MALTATIIRTSFLANAEGATTATSSSLFAVPARETTRVITSVLPGETATLTIVEGVGDTQTTRLRFSVLPGETTTITAVQVVPETFSDSDSATKTSGSSIPSASDHTSTTPQTLPPGTETSSESRNRPQSTQKIPIILGAILGTVVVLLIILGTILFRWRRRIKSRRLTLTTGLDGDDAPHSNWNNVTSFTAVQSATSSESKLAGEPTLGYTKDPVADVERGTRVQNGKEEKSRTLHATNGGAGPVYAQDSGWRPEDVGMQPPRYEEAK